MKYSDYKTDCAFLRRYRRSNTASGRNRNEKLPYPRTGELASSSTTIRRYRRVNNHKPKRIGGPPRTSIAAHGHNDNNGNNYYDNYCYKDGRGRTFAITNTGRAAHRRKRRYPLAGFPRARASFASVPKTRCFHDPSSPRVPKGRPFLFSPHESSRPSPRLLLRTRIRRLCRLCSPACFHRSSPRGRIRRPVRAYKAHLSSARPLTASSHPATS